MRKSLGLAFSVCLILLGASQTALAQHYGQTTAPVTVNGKTLPVGSYVYIAYDDGNDWLTSREYDATRLPKSSIKLIPETDFSPPLGGMVM